MNDVFPVTPLAPSARPALICFSHLRWDFVWQRPQHLMSRFAESHRLFIWEDYDIMKRSHDDHHRVVLAIANRDAERAEALMREHVIFAGEVLRRFQAKNNTQARKDAAP